ncbi:MAG TPA: ABC transporter permease subunit [Clostridia bacterium]|nr:ABC transporter permease subunit [Clostridia bacterium]
MRDRSRRIGALVLAALVLSGILSGCGAAGGAKEAPASPRPSVETARIGVMVGSATEPLAEELYPNAQIQRFNNFVDSAAALEAGKLDYAMMSYSNALRFVQSNKDMEIASDFLTDDEMCLGVAKTNPELYEKVAAEVDRLLADGSVDEMIARWIRPDASPYPSVELPMLAGAPAVKVAIVSSREPTSFLLNGQYAGLDVELICTALFNLGYRPEFLDMEFAAVPAAIESGKADMTLGMYNTPERAEKILFTAPYFPNPQVLLAMKEGGSAAGAGEGRPDVETARISVMVGSTNEQYAETHFPNAELQRFNNYVDSTAALAAGKVDYSMMDYISALRFARYDARLEIVSGFLTDEKMCLGVAKANPELFEKVAAELDRLIEDGTMADMLARWIRPDGSGYEPKEAPVLDGAPVVKVALVSSREPQVFVVNGEYAGLDIELIDTVLYNLGYRAEYLDMEFAAIPAAIESGKADMTLGMYSTPERAEKILFTTPYLSNPQVLLAMKKGGGAVEVSEGRPAVETSRISVMVGATNEQYAETHFPDADVQRFNNYVDSTAALLAGKLDYSMMDYVSALRFIKYNGELEIASDFLTDERMCLGVGKDYPELYEKVSAELDRLIANGTVEDMLARWIKPDGSDYEPKEVPVLEGAPVVKVAIASSREPQDFVLNGEYAGLDVELIGTVLYNLGYRPEFLDMEFAAVSAAIESGRAQMTLGMYYTAERAEKILFTNPFFSNPQVLIARKTNVEAGLEYNALAELSGKPVAALTGTIFDQIVLGVIPEAQLLYFNSSADELAALKNGKVDGVPFDEPVARLAVAINPELGILPELVAEDHYGISLVKDSPFTAQVNAALAAMRQDGTMQAMVDKWMGADDALKTLPELENAGENGVLRVVCYTGTEPMCYMKDGEIVGYDVELILRVAQTLGMKAEFISAEFGSMIPMLQSGKADLAAGCMSITDERKQQVDMSDAYYDGGVYIVVRKASAASAGVEKESFFTGIAASFERTFLTENRWELVVEGLGVTVLLAVCSGALGTVAGFGICMLRRGRSRAASIPAAVFIRVIQGTPIVVLLMILYYIIFGKVDVAAVLVAILGFSLNFGAYVSEMMRAGIEAVDKGQIEAARALGFTKARTFWKITFPQAARHFLPVYKGEFISMVKMTSVVGYIAIQDLTKVSDIIRSRTLEAFFPLLATAFMYFLVANVLTLLLSRVEIKLDPKRRKRVMKGVVVQ